MAEETGTLYIIATPIGNLADVTDRARQVLASVDVVLAEDTRHSKTLLRHLGIQASLRSLHEHNEKDRVDEVMTMLREGLNIGLISDAGTPLISDPGYRLVENCHRSGLAVSPIPGASALTAALSVCGLPTDQFVYLGFPPAKSTARQQAFRALAAEQRTMVIYESKHRVVGCLEDLLSVFGADRQATLLRELTKAHETIMRSSLAQLLATITEQDQQRLGEFVIVVAGADAVDPEYSPQLDRLLLQFAELVPPRKAAGLIADYFEMPKRAVYERLLKLREV